MIKLCLRWGINCEIRRLASSSMSVAARLARRVILQEGDPAPSGKLISKPAAGQADRGPSSLSLFSDCLLWPLAVNGQSPGNVFG
jgi:hypothetical protein